VLAEPRCSIRRCKHLGGVAQSDGTELTEVCICAAYPDGIPDEIAYGNDLHLVRRSDQENEIVYERSATESPTVGRAN
jgi:hypothetical protein